MTKNQIESIVSMQKEFFDKGLTLNVKYRIDALKKLQKEIKNREADI